MPHLVVSISGHGYGHVAQSAPILNLLHAHLPALRLTIRTTAAPTFLRSRMHAPFTLLTSTGDIGMLMTSALDVQVEDSCAAYRALHANWDARVEAEANLLRDLGADAVFSNVGYLPLAGAQRAGLPNAALCSLNWADIHRHFCSDESITAQIHACYAQADVFLRTTPGMPMHSLHNLVPIAPIATVGTNRRAELPQHPGLDAQTRLVLVSLGGIASRLPIENWPRIAGVRWLVQESWQVRHADAIALEALGMPFSDVLSSCDALLCKPGYGSFAEAACAGIPVLYAERTDWPESPALVDWLRQHGRCREVTRTQLLTGDLELALHALWQSAPVPAPHADGAAQAAKHLLCLLRLAGN